MKITITGRHYVGNDATYNELTREGGIIDRARYAPRSEKHDIQHRVRVNFDSKAPHEMLEELVSLGRKVRAEGIDFSLQIDRGPGSSFREGLLFRDCDVAMLCGADQIPVDKNIPYFTELAERLQAEDKVLGGAARPYRILLSDIPEGDLMRQIHEVYHMLAAGADEERKPLNPFNLDLSRGSQLFVGAGGVGGFGDMNADFAALNHNATQAQKICNYFSDISKLVQEDFSTEYAIFIHEGLENCIHIYMDFAENRFYRDLSQLSEAELRKITNEDIGKKEKFILNYAASLGIVPDVRKKLIEVVKNPETIPAIERNITTYAVKYPERFVDRVDRIMRQGLSN